MIELSDIATAALRKGNQTRFVRVESWYDDQLVDDDVPVDAGQEEVDRGSNVPERLTLTVPKRRRGVSYTPKAVGDPLAANGQMLRVTLGVGISRGQIEWLQRGWFVITESQPRGDAIEVEAAGLLWKIQEARLVSPFQPSGTFKSTIQALVEPALTVDFDAALVDRSVPANANYDDDRLGALGLTLASWPAVADVTADGYLYVTSATDSTDVVLDLTTGLGGTVIDLSGQSTRDSVYNAVVAQGTANDGQLVRGVAYDLTGPKRYGGPFNELAVPLFMDSPLITTQAQATAAAATRLATLKRTTSTFYDVEMVPHPALQVGDRVTLTDETLGLDAAPGIIEVLRLPLTAGGGSMSAKVRVL